MPHRTARLVLPAIAAIGVALTACDTNDGRQLDPPTAPLPPTTTTTIALTPTVPVEPIPPVSLQLVAPWPDGGAIPTRFTCDGEDVSPALSWSNLPADTVEVVISVTDLDASLFVHWLLLGLPPDRTSIVEDEVPVGAREWTNSFGEVGWNGPCPPAGEQHRYQFTVHALNQAFQPADDADASQVIAQLNAISGNQSSVSGTYVRSG